MKPIRSDPEELEESGPEPSLPVPSTMPSKDVIDRILFVDEFKDKKGNATSRLEEFVDSLVSPELSLTNVMSLDDIRFFRLMMNNLIDTWFSTRPPYANGFETELLADKVRFRTEIKVRRSVGADRERALLTGGPVQPFMPGMPGPMQPQRPSPLWERILGRSP